MYIFTFVIREAHVEEERELELQSKTGVDDMMTDCFFLCLMAHKHMLAVTRAGHISVHHMV